MCMFDRQTNSADPLLSININFMRGTRYLSCEIGHGYNRRILVMIPLMLYL